MEGLITFEDTHEAMATEKVVKSSNIKRARLITIPSAISAGCGLSLKFQMEDLGQIVALLSEHNIHDVKFYQIEGEGKDRTYTPFEVDL